MKLLAILVAVFTFVAADARAEIVVFKNGRSMSVKSVRVDADVATMQLRTGGEVSFPSAAIARVDPDEVPYPPDEPAAVATVQVESAVVKPDLMSEEALTARPFANLISTV